MESGPTGVSLSWQRRCNTLSRNTTLAVFEPPVLLPSLPLLPYPPPPPPPTLPSPPSSSPFRSAASSRPSRAWAVDNVIYTGRVINVLGDRCFKKAIGNRRQRRATVSPPRSPPTGCCYYEMTNYRARDRCPVLFFAFLLARRAAWPRPYWLVLRSFRAKKHRATRLSFVSSKLSLISRMSRPIEQREERMRFGDSSLAMRDKQR